MLVIQVSCSRYWSLAVCALQIHSINFVELADQRSIAIDQLSGTADFRGKSFGTLMRPAFIREFRLDGDKDRFLPTNLRRRRYHFG
jgi:hypothetical protein